MTTLDKQCRTLTQEEADELVRQRAGEFFPNMHYLFLGTRGTDGYMHYDEIFSRGKDENFHLHWARRYE